MSQEGLVGEDENRESSGQDQTAGDHDAQKLERLAKPVFEGQVNKNRARRAQELLLVKETEQHQDGGNYQSAPAVAKAVESQESRKGKQQGNHVGPRGNAIAPDECGGE